MGCTARQQWWVLVQALESVGSAGTGVGVRHEGQSLHGIDLGFNIHVVHLAPHPLSERGLVLSQLVPLTERALIKFTYGHFHIAADAAEFLWVNQFMISFIWECYAFREDAGEWLWHEMRRWSFKVKPSELLPKPRVASGQEQSRAQAVSAQPRFHLEPSLGGEQETFLKCNKIKHQFCGGSRSGLIFLRAVCLCQSCPGSSH